MPGHLEGTHSTASLPTFPKGELLSGQRRLSLGAGDERETRYTNMQGALILSQSPTPGFLCKEGSSVKKSCLKATSLEIMIRNH